MQEGDEDDEDDEDDGDEVPLILAARGPMPRSLLAGGS